MGRPLSLQKVTDFVAKHGYVLSTLYHVDSSCAFIECRSPIHQKTFVIRIPSKYDLTISADENNAQEITSVDRETSTQQRYMDMLVGGSKFDDVSLLAVSSSSLCVRHFDGTSSYYVLGRVEEEAPEEIEEVDKVTELERELDKFVTEEPATSEPAVIEVDTTADTSFDADSADESVSMDVVEEVVFEDTPPPPDDAEVMDTFVDNSVPPSLEDSEVVIGLIYVMIDLPTFFKSAKSFEDKLTTIYSLLDANEVTSRKTRMVAIDERSQRVHNKVTSRLAEIEANEATLKNQLSRLTQVMTKAEALRNKSASLEGVSNEVDELYGKTRRTIHDLNVQLLRLRDEVDNMLSSYEVALEELDA